MATNARPGSSRKTSRNAPTDVLPTGWMRSGTASQAACRIDVVRTERGPALRLAGGARHAGDFCTAMQQFAAHAYRGKRVQLKAELRCERVAGWAGLWMRVDEGRRIAAFDNMQQRPLNSTRDWASYAVVLDVVATADVISIGVLLRGSGSVEARGFAVRFVDRKVPTTDGASALPSAPVNLSLAD